MGTSILFKTMKPIIEYIKITSRVLQDRTTFEGYTELHHVLPKSLGGSNEMDNLIEIPASLHLRLHKLLYLHFGKNSKMGVAYSRMAFSGKYELTPEEFQLAREAAALRGGRNPKYNHERRKVLVGNKILKLTRKELQDRGYSQSGVSMLFGGKVDYFKDCMLVPGRYSVEEAKSLLSSLKEKGKKNRRDKNRVPKASGKRAARYDHTIYIWFNIENGEQRECTMGDLCKEFSLESNRLSRVKNGTRGSYRGWTLKV